MKTAILIVIFLAIPYIGLSDTLHVPDDFPTIQEAIDAAVNGDTVLVAPGTYQETIDFKGKTIVVMSSHGPEATLIWNFGVKVYIWNKEGPGTVLDGFTIQGTGALSGSGIYCKGSSPTIMNNIIEDNHPGIQGGGIYCHGGSPVIMNNIIRNNTVSYGFGLNSQGGGICIDEFCKATIKNNVIYGNTAFGDNKYGDGYGGGIYFHGNYLILLGNIIMDNEAQLGFGDGIYCSGDNTEITNNLVACNHGIGIYCRGNSVLTNNTIVKNTGVGLYCNCYKTITNIIVQNTIVWYNGEEQIKVEGPGVFSITYSNVQKGWPGTGNIDSDPLFVDLLNSDFHLTYTSPCRDTGNNKDVTELFDFEGDPRIAYGTVDMGADEFYTHLYVTGDTTPGGNIEGKFVGLPDTTPVGLWFGSGMLDPPMPSMFGWWYLQYPWLGPIVLGSIPSPDGVLIIPATLPSTPPAPYDLPMQALIGDELTNLCILEVR